MYTKCLKLQHFQRASHVAILYPVRLKPRALKSHFSVKRGRPLDAETVSRGRTSGQTLFRIIVSRRSGPFYRQCSFAQIRRAFRFAASLLERLVSLFQRSSRPDNLTASLVPDLDYVTRWRHPINSLRFGLHDFLMDKIFSIVAQPPSGFVSRRAATPAGNLDEWSFGLLFSSCLSLYSSFLHPYYGRFLKTSQGVDCPGKTAIGNQTNVCLQTDSTQSLELSIHQILSS